jgi:hydrogenase nickel incorporation protein HypB
MCGTCGCGGTGDGGGTRIAVPPADGAPVHDHGHGHEHDHAHDHDHDHDDHDRVHGHVREHVREHVRDEPHPVPVPHPVPPDGDRLRAEPAGETIVLEQRILAKNEDLAARNRDWLAARGIVAVNLMSSPGAGKTTLLERTVRDLAGRRPVAVVEGDQETMLDADRIKRAGAAVVQVNTGAGCHLDADMMHGALTALSPASGSLILVENVGNLVCPALFDLGERSKVVIISVTEGSDKPLKYPYMFAAADLVVINKLDLLPYVDFDVERCTAYARSVNPDVRVLTVSATTGEGLDRWYAWVADQY